jgi:hypothetical protein
VPDVTVPRSRRHDLPERRAFHSRGDRQRARQDFQDFELIMVDDGSTDAPRRSHAPTRLLIPVGASTWSIKVT